MSDAAIGIDYGVIADARRHRRRRRGGLGLLASVAVGGCVVGLAGGGQGGRGGGAPRPAASPRAAARAGSAGGVRPGSAVASLASAPSIRMPARLRVRLATPIAGERFAPDFARAHLLTQAGDALQIWLVPGRNSLCLFTIYSGDDGGGTCQLLPAVAAGELRLTRTGSDGTSVIGISPAGELEMGGTPDVR